ncbi:hypothetical protein [Prochlorococcus sp. MIT 0801]|uniref:hypothetical protein n=1 Tax=Prochlorococcus sp. MIT 0801 TaxID=1501269 RepID=UPI001CECE6C4|nr:hypothetical protein [Prochlorococcus sp. MIT 0801]
MSSWLNYSRVIYIFSNLLVLPATFIPLIDLISNISFFIAFILFLNENVLVSLVLCVVLLVKNNSNYRFNLLLIHKGEEVSKTDYQCVYLYAWCTLLRYFLIGLAVNRIFLFLE